MLATDRRAIAIFFVSIFSLFAAGTACSQTAANRQDPKLSGSEEAGSSGAAVLPAAFAIRNVSLNPTAWPGKCLEHFAGAAAALASAMRRESWLAPNELREDWRVPVQGDRSCAPSGSETIPFTLVSSAAPFSAGTALNTAVAFHGNTGSRAATDGDATALGVSAGLGVSTEGGATPAFASRTASALGTPSRGASMLPLGIAPSADATAAELAAFGKPGARIERAREEVLEILGSENACSEWFETKDAAPARTFQTLGFSIDRRGPEKIFESPLRNSFSLLREPYVARATQDSGSYTLITLNANGAFFNMQGTVLKLLEQGGPAEPSGTHVLTVGWYTGNTFEAQLVTLLHEFGHIINLLPDDSDDLDGKSARNTDEVLRHCRSEVEAHSKQARLSVKK